MPEIDSVIQYGALGILAVIVIFGLKMASKALDRADRSNDRISSAISDLTKAIRDGSLEQERRHVESQRITDKVATSLDAQLSLLKDLTFAVDKTYTLTVGRIDETAKETRHSIRNDLQVLMYNRSTKSGE